MSYTGLGLLQETIIARLFSLSFFQRKEGLTIKRKINLSNKFSEYI